MTVEGEGGYEMVCVYKETEETVENGVRGSSCERKGITPVYEK